MNALRRKIPFNVFGILLLAQTFLSHLTYGNPQDSLRPLPQINKKFLVVVHVVKADSTGRLGIDTNSIKSVVAALNPLFAPIAASFEICEFRYIDNFKFDTLDKRTNERNEIINLYQVPRRINIFYVDSLIHTTGSSIAGDASLGGIADNRDGIMMVKRFNSLGVLGHEMGHYFNLLHTFEGNGTEHADGSNCETAGDQVCDTPADPYQEAMPALYHSGCKFIYEGRDAHKDFYDPNISNMMSYYSCGCNEFTHGQYTRMGNYYLANNKIAW